MRVCMRVCVRACVRVNAHDTSGGHALLVSMYNTQYIVNAHDI